MESNQAQHGHAPDSRLWLPPAPPLPPPPQGCYEDYEPSAPPLPLPHDHDHHHDHHLPVAFPYHEHTYPTRLIDILGAALHRFWRKSHTVLRLDIRRAIRLDGPIVRSTSGGSNRLQLKRQNEGRADEYADEWEPSRPSQGWLRGIQGGGAQLKLMQVRERERGENRMRMFLRIMEPVLTANITFGQIWDFPDTDTGLPSLPWDLNFGFGAKIEMDKGGHLEPQMRLRAKHVALHLLPMPLLELRGKWPLGGSRLAINIHYRVPLLHLSKFWESPTAQLCLNLYNPIGTGFHLSPGGLEFDEHVVNIGQNTKLRVAASVDFPRQFPLKAGEQPIRVHVNRLGVKARIS